MRVIPHFNVGEDSSLCFLMRTERSAIDQFTLKGGEKTLAQCVVIAAAGRPIEDVRQYLDSFLLAAKGIDWIRSRFFPGLKSYRRQRNRKCE